MNETMKASSSLIANIRDLARELLRARWISNVLQNVMFLNNRIAEENKVIDNCNKRIAQANYDISKLDPENPSYQNLLEIENDTIQMCKKDLEKQEEIIKKLNEGIVEENATIAKIEAGELKVMSESLDEKSKELIEAYYKQKVTEIAEE